MSVSLDFGIYCAPPSSFLARSTHARADQPAVEARRVHRGAGQLRGAQDAHGAVVAAPRGGEEVRACAGREGERSQ